MKRNGFQITAMFAAAGILTVSAMVSVIAQSNTGFRVGLLGGVNYNYVNAPTEEFVQVPNNTGFTLHDFSGASGLAGYGGVTGEYLFNDLLGVSLRATFDARCVEKEDGDAVFTPHLWYVGIEPGFRVNLGMPELHAIVGGTVAIKMLGEYDYEPGNAEGAQAIADQELQNVNDVAFGAWAGFGYDFRLTDENSGVGLYITPFAEGSYLFDQKEPDVEMADDEMWNTLTVRGGVQIKAQF